MDEAVHGGTWSRKTSPRRPGWLSKGLWDHSGAHSLGSSIGGASLHLRRWRRRDVCCEPTMPRASHRGRKWLFCWPQSGTTSKAGNTWGTPPSPVRDDPSKATRNQGTTRWAVGEPLVGKWQESRLKRVGRAGQAWAGRVRGAGERRPSPVIPPVLGRLRACEGLRGSEGHRPVYSGHPHPKQTHRLCRHRNRPSTVHTSQAQASAHGHRCLPEIPAQVHSGTAEPTHTPQHGSARPCTQAQTRAHGVTPTRARCGTHPSTHTQNGTRCPARTPGPHPELPACPAHASAQAAPGRGPAHARSQEGRAHTRTHTHSLAHAHTRSSTRGRRGAAAAGACGARRPRPGAAAEPGWRGRGGGCGGGGVGAGAA